MKNKLFLIICFFNNIALNQTYSFDVKFSSAIQAHSMKICHYNKKIAVGWKCDDTNYSVFQYRNNNLALVDLPHNISGIQTLGKPTSKKIPLIVHAKSAFDSDFIFQCSPNNCNKMGEGNFKKIIPINNALLALKTNRRSIQLTNFNADGSNNTVILKELFKFGWTFKDLAANNDGSSIFIAGTKNIEHYYKNKLSNSIKVPNEYKDPKFLLISEDGSKVLGELKNEKTSQYSIFCYHQGNLEILDNVKSILSQTCNTPEYQHCNVGNSIVIKINSSEGKSVHSLIKIDQPNQPIILDYVKGNIKDNIEELLDLETIVSNTFNKMDKVWTFGNKWENLDHYFFQHKVLKDAFQNLEFHGIKKDALTELFVGIVIDQKDDTKCFKVFTCDFSGIERISSELETFRSFVQCASPVKNTVVLNHYDKDNNSFTEILASNKKTLIDADALQTPNTSIKVKDMSMSNEPILLGHISFEKYIDMPFTYNINEPEIIYPLDIDIKKGFTHNYANRISFLGNSIVGYMGNKNRTKACIWNRNENQEGLSYSPQLLPGKATFSEANAISGDNRFVVGSYMNARKQLKKENFLTVENKCPKMNSFIWKVDDPYLIKLPSVFQETQTIATCIAGNGSIIGGYSGQNPCIWTWDSQNISTLKIHLLNQGAYIESLDQGSGKVDIISYDGKLVIGKISDRVCIWSKDNNKYYGKELIKILDEQAIELPQQILKIENVIWLAPDKKSLIFTARERASHQYGCGGIASYRLNFKQAL